MATETVPAHQLVRDFTLYPRPDVDSSHVAGMVEAMKAGIVLGAIVACRRTKRIADGFHRYEAHVRLHGPNAPIRVEWRDYAHDRDLYADAADLNAAHGRKLTSFDKVRIIARGRELGLTMNRLAAILRLTTERARDLLESRTATGPKSAPFATTGEDGRTQIALKGGNKHMAGKRLTQAQAEANEKSGGMSQQYFVNQVIAFLRADLLEPDNPNLFRSLEVLHGLIEEKVLAAA